MGNIRYLVFFSSILALAGCETLELDRKAVLDPVWSMDGAEDITSTTLRTFESQEEFDVWRSRLYELASERDFWWATRPKYTTLASLDPSVPVCDPNVEDCEEGDADDMIVVTGSRINNPTATSITNTQEASIDEGDIIKNYGRFLITLQDGRLFSIDTGESSEDLRLADRIDVYETADHDPWYDEILMDGNLLVVTGYSYDEDASEFRTFTINEDGTFNRGQSFLMSSSDYFDWDNSATRLVDGKLVVQTTLYLENYGRDDKITFPSMRRWIEGAGFVEDTPLISATDIYYPVQASLEPAFHTITSCPLTDEELNCEAVAITAPWYSEFYVTRDYAYLWTGYGADEINGNYDDRSLCGANYLERPFEPEQSGLYRIPFDGSPPEAAIIYGTPNDRFSLQEREGRFYAFVQLNPVRCKLYEDNWPDDGYTYYPPQPTLLDLPSYQFSTTPNLADDRFYTRLPSAKGDWLENRFSENYLIYGGRSYWGGPPWDDVDDPEIEESDNEWEDESPQLFNLVAVDLKNPTEHFILPARHNIFRLETFGDGAIATGYRQFEGLNITSVSLSGRPIIRDRYIAENMVETEGRSHAFNGILNADGTGIFGLPLRYTEFSEEEWDLSEEEEQARKSLQYFSTTRQMEIKPAGGLQGAPPHPDYECEVSCVDWYGNSRPVFLNGRIFALLSSQLVEGTLIDGQIIEIGRVDITAPEVTSVSSLQ